MCAELNGANFDLQFCRQHNFNLKVNIMNRVNHRRTMSLIDFLN